MELTFDKENSKKNTRKGKFESTQVGDGFYMVKVENQEKEPLSLSREMDKSWIQFYFAPQGGAEFLFNEGKYRLKLEEEKSLLFYNPLLALPLNMMVNPGSRIVFLFITVENLHRLFVEESEEIEFLNKENIGKKFYADRPLPPLLIVALNQLLTNSVSGPAKNIFEKAKAYEILALYLNKGEDKDVDQCPFLNDEENVERVREAKRILIDKMANPPSLKELSREIGLNEYRLKEGFKNIYGKTVFQFLNDYRLDVARHMLDSDGVKVNEAAYHIGYTNPSHFIAAFKKKFGITPKKYLIAKQ